MVSRKLEFEYSAIASTSEADRQCSQICGKRCLMPREQTLEPVDLQIGMNAALHQHARAAHLERLGDLLVDLLEVENVALV